MTTTQRDTVVGVFESRADADRAVTALQQAGFTKDQIGVVARDAEGNVTNTKEDGGNYAGEGAVAGLGQQHVVGGNDHEPATGQRPGDLTPDRPAGGVPVGRPQLLQGRLLGGVEAVGGRPERSLPGRGGTLARPEPEGGCSAQPPDDTPEVSRAVDRGICHWGPPDSVLAGPRAHDSWDRD